MNRELILSLIVVSLLPSITLAAPAGPARAGIFGDIITSRISIEPGAIFTGTCNMGGNLKQEINNSEGE
jgi:hypothetical protein